MFKKPQWNPHDIKSKLRIDQIAGIDLAVISTKIQQFDSHINIANNNAHAMSNVTGLVAALSDASIKTKYEANANTNAFTDAEQTKLSTALVANAISGTFTTVDGKTITVVNGQISSIV